MPTPTEPRHWHEVPHAPAPGCVLGQRDTLPDGTPQLGQLATGGGPEKPFRYVLMRSGHAVTAYVNRCAHFGVPLAVRQEHLKFEPHQSISCNVHYARYRWSDGLCDRGECEGASLLSIPLVVDADGSICISRAATA